jgi:hypothetical protein
MLKGTTGKGIFHAALAALSIAEMFTASTKKRAALLGACAGYHVYATLYHFYLEETPDTREAIPWDDFKKELLVKEDIVTRFGQDDELDHNDERCTAWEEVKPKRKRRKKA